MDLEEGEWQVQSGEWGNMLYRDPAFTLFPDITISGGLSFHMIQQGGFNDLCNSF